VLDHELVPFSEELGALAAGPVAELFKGHLGGRNGLLGVLGVKLGAGADELPRGWV
jgi:hypothetical protein